MTRSGWKCAGATLLVAGAIAAPLACRSLTPPAVLDVDAIPIDRAIERCPRGTEFVELVPALDVRLRGVFVRARAGAPVVLHLLESSGSVAAQRGGYEDVLARLADQGLSSLMVDYTGVGASSGERSPKNLERDARAMWDEAVRRADGDPANVIVRGTSLGTIAAALLLRSGARPGAVVLVLPVRPQTVAEHFARNFYGPLAYFAAATFYGSVSDVDVGREIAACSGPLLAVSTPNEILISEPEQRELEDAVRRAGGEWRMHAGGHLRVTAEARGGLREEFEFYARRFPPPPATDDEVAELVSRLPGELAERFGAGTRERERLAAHLRFGRASDPRLVAATALAEVEPEAAMRLRWILAKGVSQRDPVEDLVAMADLRDPAGPLPLDRLEACFAPVDLTMRGGGEVWRPGPHDAVQCARTHGEGYALRWSMEFPGGNDISISSDLPELWRSMSEPPLPESDLRRRFARVMLKAYGRADRLTKDADSGAVVLEVKDRDEWKPLDFDHEPEQHTMSIEMRLGGTSTIPIR